MPTYAAIAEAFADTGLAGARRLRSPRRRRSFPPARWAGRPAPWCCSATPAATCGRRSRPAAATSRTRWTSGRAAPSMPLAARLDGPGGVPERPPVAPVPAVGDARRAGVAVADRAADPPRLRALARLPGGPAAGRGARRPAVARRPPEPVHDLCRPAVPERLPGRGAPRAGSTSTACEGHLRADDEPHCMELGCRSRDGCPVGREYRFPPDQVRFHQQAFLRARS